MAQGQKSAPMKNAYNLLFILAVCLVSFSAKAQKQGPEKIAGLKLVRVAPSFAEQMRNGTLQLPGEEEEREVNPKRRHGNRVVPGKGFPRGADPLIEQLPTRSATRAPMQPIIPDLVFDAKDDFEFAPTDPTGAVGPNHYVAAWNTGFRIFDKTGNPLTPEAKLGTLFEGNNAGDPIVLYDAAADRFIITEFEDDDFENDDDPDYDYQHGLNIAVCAGPDPVNDEWYIYTSYDTGKFPDYPKYSVWHDGYYVTANIYNTENQVFVMERDSLLAGKDARFVGFPLTGIQDIGFYSPQFFNAGNPTLPAGGPATVVYMQDDAWAGVADDHLKLWEITMDWQTIENSSISNPTQITTADFNSVFDGGDFANLTQPNGQDIDALQATIMNQAQFRKFPTYNSAIFNFVVDVDGSSSGELAGIRWYELRQDAEGAPWSIFQEGTYVSPSGANAFAGSMVMDDEGNIALGYSTVSPTQSVGIRFTGRYVNDPLGEMSVPESTIANSTGNSSFERYADYTHMTLDPVNERDFWFITEYFNPDRADVVAKFHLQPDLRDDLMVTQIVAPQTGNVGASEDVTITIRNNGTNAQSNFEVTYSIDGGTAVAENFSGTLAFNESADYTFSVPADLSVDGKIYTITADVNLTGDEDTANDAITKQVQNIFQNDIGVSAILSPDQYPEGTTTAEVRVEITNYGDQSQTNFPVYFKLDQNAQINEVFTDVLPGQSTAIYSFTQTINVNATGTYDLIAGTDLNGDQDATNDEFSLQIIRELCIPQGNCEEFNDGVTEFTLGETTITTDCSATGYTDNTSTIIPVDLSNNPFTGTLQTGFDDSAYAFFVDIDNNNTFESDEMVANGLVALENTDTEFTLTLPSNLPIGDYRMRVRGEDEDYDGDVTDPCDDLEFGRINDYTLRVTASMSVENSTFAGANLEIIEPEKNHFTITLRTTERTDDLKFAIYNLAGQTLASNWISNTSGKYTYDLDMSYAASGIYVVRLGDESGFATKKIAVK